MAAELLERVAEHIRQDEVVAALPEHVRRAAEEAQRLLNAAVAEPGPGPGWRVVLERTVRGQGKARALSALDEAIAALRPRLTGSLNYGGFSVKFHRQALAEVIAMEQGEDP